MHRRLLLAAALAVVTVPAIAQGARDNIDALIEQHAKANGVPASFVHAVVKRESNYNPKAKGGSALGLMQIKPATARSLGYQGDAAGLLDPATNLKYGVAYLAGAYRTAQGNITQAYGYYNRGYYYAAKRQGISTEVASVVAPVAASASAVASLFTGAPPADTNFAAANVALAYAPTAAAAPAETVAVPLPPRRPAAFGAGDSVEMASLRPTQDPAADQPQADSAGAAQTVSVPLPPRRPDAFGAPVQVASADLSNLTLAATPAAPTPAAATSVDPAADTVAVPLPPRRPSAERLAAVVRPAAPRKTPAGEPVLEATALTTE
ncbi:lytic transglycosylase domain-containing protein [Methylobacterium sp. J-092]|uniref:lytic transglycosylase domain-containing protein n=1 Tax=Methylobacterium sp. J-092 TaxID=2836667 RepID=UPI001FBB6A7D|nr:transglycosylase SLT domain-containing protein [Methylobacterium sp. J-092]MCJ2006559.1 transglycosylase SLT domain-containing protein [Methylobacterium sp. J-092]